MSVPFDDPYFLNVLHLAVIDRLEEDRDILSDDQTLLRRRVRQMVDDYLSARGLGAPDDVRLRLTVDVLNEISGYGPLQEYLDRPDRSEEHTSELQSRENLVCRLLLEKKK